MIGKTLKLSGNKFLDLDKGQVCDQVENEITEQSKSNDPTWSLSRNLIWGAVWEQVIDRVSDQILEKMAKTEETE